MPVHERSKTIRFLRLCGATLACAFIAGAWGDEFGYAPDEPEAEFHFTRLVYDSPGGYGSNYFAVDYPEAEYHFMQGVTRLTRVEGARRARMFRITDPAIFDYPWLYAVEVGYWYLDNVEAAQLREYLLRGGFMMVDDFHGTREWNQFVESMQRVFPDRPIVDIPDDDEVLHVLYDLDTESQIYGVRPLSMGMTYEYDGVDPKWRGVYDDDGRLMVAINHNMDLGDAWEHADDPGYPEPLTALAYRYAVNYVIYAMTH
jgi:hypothetical protein